MQHGSELATELTPVQRQLGLSCRFLSNGSSGKTAQSTLLFSTKRVDSPVQFETVSPLNDKTYRVSVNYEREVHPDEPEYIVFLQDFLAKDIFRSAAFSSYRRLYMGAGSKDETYQMALYCPEHMKSVKQYDLEIWPGLKYSIKRVNQVPMLNLDADYMIVRLETAFDLMQDIKKDLPLAGKVELQNEIRRQFKGKIVVTRYNSALYRIKDVDFTLSPTS